MGGHDPPHTNGGGATMSTTRSRSTRVFEGPKKRRNRVSVRSSQPSCFVLSAAPERGFPSLVSMTWITLFHVTLNEEAYRLPFNRGRSPVFHETNVRISKFADRRESRWPMLFDSSAKSLRKQ
jgi:hypothetical protein